MEKKGYKLSIIVPIYNVENYIGRCVLSLMKQTAGLDKYEVIFVNDGTKDNSIDVLKEFVKGDASFNYTILHKMNGGLSSARNFGVNNASGEYIWFVDSDDWIEPNSVEILLPLIEQSPDIVLMSQMFKNVGEIQKLKYECSISDKVNGIEILGLNPPSCAVSYICKREFLNDNNFRFKEGICFEDSELTPKMLYKAQYVVTTNMPLYHHYMREDSITHNISKRSVDDCIVLLQNHVDYYKNIVSNEHKRLYATNISSKILTTLKYSLVSVGKTNKDLDLFFKKNREIGEMLYLSLHRYTHYYGLILKLFPARATLIFYIINMVKGMGCRNE